MPERTPAAKPNRPRDANAPPKPERPRDELGRPLPWGSESRLHLERFDANTVEENHRLGIQYLNARRFFAAHEAWETCWKQSKGTRDAEFFKGLSQLGAGYVHHQRGNPHGAFTLLRRGAGRVAAYERGHHGVDTTTLAELALAQADAVERARDAGEPTPDLTFPTI
jgi:predicted metal-dependent hydrolase